MNAFESLSEFTKTGQLKHLKEAVKSLKDFNMANVDKSDEPCGSCMFHVGRIQTVKNLFQEDVLGPSHCFLSNVFSASYKKDEDSKDNSDYVISCFGESRENWVEPPKKKRFKLDSIRTDVCDKMFDMAKIFTELTKFAAALEEMSDKNIKES
jgi:hypothetical protein